tara:strand:+ start:1872 stop:2003 length:132 start_codon:yes stop_codon:yes gene_type:complete
MKNTKKLIKDLCTLNAPEELYIVITFAKIGAFLCGLAIGHYYL